MRLSDDRLLINIGLLFVWTSSWQGVLCFVPIPCASNLTKAEPYCCPVPKGYTTPCGFPKLGHCHLTQVFNPAQWIPQHRPIYKTDFRFNWPTRLFTHSCECKGRRHGFDCSKCWFGYEGKNCERRRTHTRRNIKSYSELEKRRFVDVLLLSRKVQSDYVIPIVRPNEKMWSGKFMKVDIMEEINLTHWFCGFAKIMNNVSYCRKMEQLFYNYGHYDVGFATYHRYLMTYWESLLRDIAIHHLGHKDFTFPYWDWFNMRECDICTNDLIGASTDSFDPVTNATFVSKLSPFGDPEKWPVFCQNRSQMASICAPCALDRSNPTRLTRSWTFLDFPTTEEVIRVLRINRLQDYNKPCQSFTNVLEAGWNCMCAFKPHLYGLHAGVHGYNTGTLHGLAASIFDPLFIFHHIQVDRIFERWFKESPLHPREMSNIPKSATECRDCNIGTFFPSTKHRSIFGPSKLMGYKYDNLNLGSLSEDVKVADMHIPQGPPTCNLHFTSWKVKD